MTTTDKQARYILHLLSQKGFDTRYMNSKFRQLGATMQQRSGTVEGWVRNMTVSEASRLIDQLKSL